MSSRLRKRADRIKEEISILRVLSDLGFQVMEDVDREQQFPCSFHGDGQDNSYSARVYPDTRSFYCFGCDKSRDVIEVVKEAKGFGFIECLQWIENRYNLPSLPWEKDQREKSNKEQMEEALNPILTAEKLRKSIESFLQSLTSDKDFSMSRILAFWEALDKLTWILEQKNMNETKGKSILFKLREKILRELHGKY